jgi:hypothetical protein
VTARLGHIPISAIHFREGEIAMPSASSYRVFVVTFLVLRFASACLGQRVADARNPAIPGASEPVPKFTFYLFWKNNDPMTQQMSADLHAAVAKRATQADLTTINVTDPASKATVDRFQVSRMPLPAVICVAPNGAVTGAFIRKITDQAVEGSIVSPAAAAVVKALQDKKIAIILVAPNNQAVLPIGAAEFVADPAFQARTTVIPVVASDPSESKLLASMQIDPRNVADSTVVVLAPPSALVGKFPSTATSAQIAAALHAAGKCCNDPNCKHNRQGQQQ